ncbi:hypothetical protein AB1K54_05770 [Microbacterium sp. BWT-B31]|uniref:hypothetical protein n=1 Tax=Microbacterium sp. BWT-B31 TaxID=3232072 RepID=UPI0035287837
MSSVGSAPEVDRTPGALARGWLIAHLVSLLVTAALIIVAARGQYFYYDEWDFLAERSEWNLLTTHVGHLSLVPQLLTTITKYVFGLHSYWPYLLPAIAVHLLIIHLLWRVMMRSSALPLLALLGAMVFGVLAPGADNVLWAFQVGFMTPLALGLAALLIVMRPAMSRWALVWVSVMLVVSLGFSGTALPMIAVVVLYILVHHGWRLALVPALASAIVYGAWYLIFNRAPAIWDNWRADTPSEVFFGVPEFVVHGFLDSVRSFLPFAASPALGVVSAVLLVLLIVWIVFDLRRTGLRSASVAHYLVLALVLFAILTAFSRVGLGIPAASVGRYAYVYGLLLTPAGVAALGVAARRSRTLTAIAAALLVVLFAYNAGGFVTIARAQSAAERTVPRAMSAAIELGGCDDQSLAGRVPSPVMAPTLTMADICAFLDRGQFEPVAFTPDDLLAVRMVFDLTAEAVDVPAPDLNRCDSPRAGGAVAYDPDTQLVHVAEGATLTVHATEGDAHADVPISVPSGASRLTGLDQDVVLSIVDTEGLCVFTE